MDKNVRKDIIKFSLIEALYFSIFAISSYQTVYLQNVGMTSTQIGFLVSVSSIMGLVILPLWGMISDMHLSARKTFLLTVSITVVMLSFMPLIGTAAGNRVGFYFVYIPLVFLFKQPSNSMMDSWVVRELTPKNIGYGRVRMWGSIGYAVISLLLGNLVGGVLSVNSAFMLMLPLWVVMLFVCNWRNRVDALPPSEKEPKGKEKFQLRLLLNNPPLIMFLLYSIGLNIYLSVTLVFMAYILPVANVDPGQLGTVTGVRAIVEIISMTLGTRLIKKIKLKYIMILPGILFGLEHFFYQYASNIYGILGIMVLSGLAGGFVYSLGPSYIYEVTPIEVTNTAQSCNAMTLTLCSIIGSITGGVVIERWGVQTFTTALGIIIFSLTALFTASLFLQKPGKAQSNTN